MPTEGRKLTCTWISGFRFPGFLDLRSSTRFLDFLDLSPATSCRSFSSGFAPIGQTIMWLPFSWSYSGVLAIFLMPSSSDSCEARRLHYCLPSLVSELFPCSVPVSSVLAVSLREALPCFAGKLLPSRALPCFLFAGVLFGDGCFVDPCLGIEREFGDV